MLRHVFSLLFSLSLLLHCVAMYKQARAISKQVKPTAQPLCPQIHYTHIDVTVLKTAFNNVMSCQVTSSQSCQDQEMKCPRSNTARLTHTRSFDFEVTGFRERSDRGEKLKQERSNSPSLPHILKKTLHHKRKALPLFIVSMLSRPQQNEVIGVASLVAEFNYFLIHFLNIKTQH